MMGILFSSYDYKVTYMHKNSSGNILQKSPLP